MVASDHKLLFRGSQQPAQPTVTQEEDDSTILLPGLKQKAPDANSKKSTDDANTLSLISDFEESDYIPCIEPSLRLPEATMTREPDTSADL